MGSTVVINPLTARLDKSATMGCAWTGLIVIPLAMIPPPVPRRHASPSIWNAGLLTTDAGAWWIAVDARTVTYASEGNAPTILLAGTVSAIPAQTKTAVTARRTADAAADRSVTTMRAARQRPANTSAGNAERGVTSAGRRWIAGPVKTVTYATAENVPTNPHVGTVSAIPARKKTAVTALRTVDAKTGSSVTTMRATHLNHVLQTVTAMAHATTKQVDVVVIPAIRVQVVLIVPKGINIGIRLLRIA